MKIFDKLTKTIFFSFNFFWFFSVRSELRYFVTICHNRQIMHRFREN